MADGSLIFDTLLDPTGFKKGAAALGSISLKAAGLVAAAGATATLAIGKMALSAFAEYEQLVGGVDTLFKNSSQKVQEYAAVAFKTAGLSANEYMQTVTGFSASLLQSLGGDTEKAADYANTAIIDMADNANKMGSSMESIQNAYQGFAKQNYTMLDNLKLGYGGTKSEMERLLADAEKISGIKYDLSSYADVVSAIHIIQEQMGIAGTTAQEAEETISGSLASMKSAAQNFIAGLGNADADMTMLTKNLIESFKVVLKNVVPIIENIARALPEGIKSLVPAIEQILSNLINVITPIFQELTSAFVQIIPEIANVALNLITTFVSTLSDNLPLIAETLIQLAGAILDALAEVFPQVITIVSQLVVALVDGLKGNGPAVFEAGVQLLNDIIMAILDAAPQLMEAAVEMLVFFIDGIRAVMPMIADKMPLLIEKMVDALITAMPMLIEGAILLMTGFANGFLEALPSILVAIGDIVAAIFEAIRNHDWAGTGKEMIEILGNGVKSMGSSLASKIEELIREGLSKIKAMGSEFLDAGKDMVMGIINGLKEKASELANSAKEMANSALASVKSVLGIKSPSRKFRDEVGKPIVQGIAVGIKSEQDKLNKSIIEMSEEALGIAMNEARNYEEIGKIYSDKMAKGIKKSADLSIDAVKSLVNHSVLALAGNNKKAKSEYVKAGKEISTAYAKAIKDGIAKVQEEISAEVQRITQEAQQQYDDIIAKKDDMEQKLAGLGELFTIDQESGNAVLENINNQIDAIKRYDEVLTNLKSKGAGDDFLNEVTKLGVSEGTKFGEALLKLSDDQFKAYQANWEEKQKLAKEVAMKFYKDQLDALQSDFVNKLDGTLKSVPNTVKNVGVNAIEGMIRGMDSRKQGAINKAREIADAVIAEMQRAMDIHSPSRVMRDLIGKNIVRGIEVGITDEQRNMVARMRSAVESAKAEMSAAVSAKTNAGSRTQTITNNNDNGVTQTVIINTPVKSPIEMMREARRSAKELAYGY